MSSSGSKGLNGGTEQGERSGAASDLYEVGAGLETLPDHRLS